MEIIKAAKIEIEISTDSNMFLKYNDTEEDYGTHLLKPITPNRVGLIV